MATQHRKRNSMAKFLNRLTGYCIALILGTIPMGADAGDILIGTSVTGSFSHFVGRAICRNINRSFIDLNCRAIPAPDGIHNLTNLQEGSLDLALVDSSLLYDAVHKAGYFEFMDIRYDNLGFLLPLYDLPIVLVARKDSEIHSLEKAKGKRINAGAPRSREHQALDLIMAAKGWTKKDFRVFQELPAALSQDTMAFCHGTTEAMVHIGVHPDSVLRQLMSLCEAVPVDMDDGDITRLVDRHPAFSKITIHAAAYPGMEKPVATFGTTVILVASLSLDKETTRSIMTALEKNQTRLQNSHPALGAFSIKRKSGSELGVSLHPGADAYFSAQGK